MRKELLTAFNHMTYGIYVLTVKHKDTLNGMIASWVTQISDVSRHYYIFKKKLILY